MEDLAGLAATLKQGRPGAAVHVASLWRRLRGKERAESLLAEAVAECERRGQESAWRALQTALEETQGWAGYERWLGRRAHGADDRVALARDAACGGASLGPALPGGADGRRGRAQGTRRPPCRPRGACRDPQPARPTRGGRGGCARARDRRGRARGRAHPPRERACRRRPLGRRRGGAARPRECESARREHDPPLRGSPRPAPADGPAGGAPVRGPRARPRPALVRGPRVEGPHALDDE